MNASLARVCRHILDSLRPPRSTRPERRLRLEQLEDRNLPSASWLGNMAEPDGAVALIAPVVHPDGTARVIWDGKIHKAVAGQWVARFDDVTGDAFTQMKMIQRELSSSLPADLRATVVRQLGLDGQVLIQVSTAVPEYMIQPLAKLTNVRYVEPNIADETVALVPNDPYFDQEYGLQNTGQVIGGQTGIAGADIKATQAWDVTTGSYGFVVADIDTGADFKHPDLRDNIWLNNAEIPASRLVNLKRYVSNPANPDDTTKPITFADLNDSRNWGAFKITPHDDGTGSMVVDADDVLAPMDRDAQGHDLGTGGWAYPGNTRDGDLAHPNDFVGWDFVHDNNRPFDDHYHGTHTAGTIGAEGGNGIGVTGVNWHTSLMVLKSFDASGSASDADIAAAVNYSVLHGARVSNNSYGGDGISQEIYDAVKNARDNGALYVAAAGNSGANIDTYDFSPAVFTRDTSAGPALDNVITVAATDNRDQLAYFSNFGAGSVQLGAPGVDVLSTIPTDVGGYAFVSGTSMATPHVTGAATLLWGYSPSLTYLQIKQALLGGVDSIPALSGITSTGGRLRVPVPSPSPPPPSPSPPITSTQQVFAVPLPATAPAPIPFAATAPGLAYVLTQQPGTLNYGSTYDPPENRPLGEEPFARYRSEAYQFPEASPGGRFLGQIDSNGCYMFLTGPTPTPRGWFRWECI
jgi:subtilisin family serine protease